MRCPRWLYRWVDHRGRIPAWVRWLWPTAHWCQQMDGLLIVDFQDALDNCYCGRVGPRRNEIPAWVLRWFYPKAHWCYGQSWWAKSKLMRADPTSRAYPADLLLLDQRACDCWVSGT